MQFSPHDPRRVPGRFVALPPQACTTALRHISGPEKDDPLSIFASHPMTADRMAMLEAAGGGPAGEPLLSFCEWRALKAICK
jgi:hypothetical protein